MSLPWANRGLKIPYVDRKRPAVLKPGHGHRPELLKKLAELAT